MDFQRVTLTVSLQISLYYSPHKVFSSLLDFQLSTELTGMPTPELWVQFCAATANYLAAISSQSSSTADSRDFLNYYSL
jgi:hypothetical protein